MSKIWKKMFGKDEVEVNVEVLLPELTANRTYNGWINFQGIDETLATVGYSSYQVWNGNAYQVNANAICPLSILDKRYMFANGPSAGVSSFNSRSGVVTLLSQDVVSALGYTPANGNISAGVTSFDGRTGEVTLGSGDVVAAVGYVPADKAEIAVVGYTGMYDDLLNTPAPYTLPTASAETLGGIKVGSNLTVSNGVLSVNLPSPQTVPTASASQLGVIRVGSNLTIDANGILSATGGGGNITGNYLQSQNLTYNLNSNATWTGACTTSPAQSGYAFMGTSYQPAGSGNHSVLLTATAKAVDMGSYVYVNDYDPGDTEIRSWSQGGKYNQLNIGATDTTLTSSANKTWSANSILTQSYADNRYVLNGGTFATIPISAQPFLNANVSYGTANMPSLNGYMLAGQNTVNKWNNPNSPPSLIQSFSQSVVSGIGYSTNGNSPQISPALRNVLSYYTYPNQQSKWYSCWGDFNLDALKSTLSQRFEQYGSDETTVQGYSEANVVLGSGASGSSPLQLTSTQTSTTTGTPQAFTVGLSVNGSCQQSGSNWVSNSTVTLTGTANLTWTGASVLTRDYADTRYVMKSTALSSGRTPLTGEAKLKDGTILELENGLIVDIRLPEE